MNWLDRFVIGVGRLLSWGFLVIALMMAYEIVVRYGFNAPTIWAHEIAGFIAAVAFIFGGAYCMAERSHMRIGLLADKAPPAVRRVLDLLSLLAGVVFLGGLAVAMWSISDRALLRFTADGLWMPERSGTSWNTPLPSFAKLALLLGAALFLLVVLRQLGQLLLRWRNGGAR